MTKIPLPPSSIPVNIEKFMKDFEKVCKTMEEISRKLNLLIEKTKGNTTAIPTNVKGKSAVKLNIRQRYVAVNEIIRIISVCQLIIEMKLFMVLIV